MTRPPQFYDWFIQLRHAEKGFGKSFNIGAYTFEAAVRDAKRELERQGYKPDEFDVIELKRGRFL